MKIKGKHLVLSVILLITGFILSFSFQLTNQEAREHPNNKDWEREDQLRTTILSIQKRNRDLREELSKIQSKVQEKENEIGEQEATTSKLVDDLNKFRIALGLVEVKGPGISVSLKDASYIPDEHNPNNYIVHEEHIRTVINELLLSSAEAIAINGQRISHTASIVCVGPVVSVNGVQYAAPFEITAIGDAETMENALYLTGNVVDKLVNDGIEVRVEKKEVTMDPILPTEG
jgi:uncharacterized protein YlxW (UPF0749 family)